jgi:hypothetical protein
MRSRVKLIPTHFILSVLALYIFLCVLPPMLTAAEIVTPGDQRNVSVLAPDSVARVDLPPTDSANQATTGNPLWALPLAALSATREMPIFSPSRRPPAILQPAPPKLPPPKVVAARPARPPIALVGAIAGENGGIAIFVDEITKNIVRMKTGETYTGWTLQLIKGREATMEREAESVILTLPGPPSK